MLRLSVLVAFSLKATGCITKWLNNLPLTSNHRTAFPGNALRAIQQLTHSLTAVNDIDFRFGGGVLYDPLVSSYGKRRRKGEGRKAPNRTVAT